MATRQTARDKRRAEFEIYLDAVREAYRLARGERAGELRGKRIRRFDDRGIHPFSEACGRLSTLIPSWVREDSAKGKEREEYAQGLDKITETFGRLWAERVQRLTLEGGALTKPPPGLLVDHFDLRQAGALDAEEAFRDEVVKEWSEGLD